MTTQAPAIARPLRGAGALAIIATLAIASIVGAFGLWNDLSVPLGVVPSTWVLISGAVWGVYGLLLLALFIPPARRAQLLIVGTLLAVAWGGLAATDFAGRANTAVVNIAATAASDGDGTWANVVVNPTIEEILKTLGVILLLLLPAARLMGPRTGLVVGALVGASFQVVENFVFTLDGMFKDPSDPVTVLVGMLFARGLVGLFSHVVYTAVIGAALGWALASTASWVRRSIVAVGAFALMAGLHSWSNWTSRSEDSSLFLVSMGLGLVALIVAWVLAQRSDVARPTEAA
jgi:RsiW-degrading membrane proteinase PrsW (M82 family)